MRAVLGVAGRAGTGLGQGFQWDGWLRKRESISRKGLCEALSSSGCGSGFKGLAGPWGRWPGRGGVDGFRKRGFFSVAGRATPYHHPQPLPPALRLSGLLSTMSDPCPGWHWLHSMAHAHQELQAWLNGGEKPSTQAACTWCLAEVGTGDCCALPGPRNEPLAAANPEPGRLPQVGTQGTGKQHSMAIDGGQQSPADTLGTAEGPKPSAASLTTWLWGLESS